MPGHRRLDRGRRRRQRADGPAAAARRGHRRGPLHARHRTLPAAGDAGLPRVAGTTRVDVRRGAPARAAHRPPEPAPGPAGLRGPDPAVQPPPGDPGPVRLRQVVGRQQHPAAHREADAEGTHRGARPARGVRLARRPGPLPQCLSRRHRAPHRRAQPGDSLLAADLLRAGRPADRPYRPERLAAGLVHARGALRAAQEGQPGARHRPPVGRLAGVLLAQGPVPALQAGQRAAVRLRQDQGPAVRCLRRVPGALPVHVQRLTLRLPAAAAQAHALERPGVPVTRLHRPGRAQAPGHRDRPEPGAARRASDRVGADRPPGLRVQLLEPAAARVPHPSRLRGGAPVHTARCRRAAPRQPPRDGADRQGGAQVRGRPVRGQPAPERTVRDRAGPVQQLHLPAHDQPSGPGVHPQADARG